MNPIFFRNPWKAVGYFEVSGPNWPIKFWHEINLQHRTKMTNWNLGFGYSHFLKRPTEQTQSPNTTTPATCNQPTSLIPTTFFFGPLTKKGLGETFITMRSPRTSPSGFVHCKNNWMVWAVWEQGGYWCYVSQWICKHGYEKQKWRTFFGQIGKEADFYGRTWERG